MSGLFFTKEETEVILMLAEGYQCKEIAEKNDWTESAVAVMCRKLRGLTGSKTNAHLIANLYHSGYLRPRKGR
jgi:DNA-binding NarL/FixJ family response regulator